MHGVSSGFLSRPVAFPKSNENIAMKFDVATINTVCERVVGEPP